MPKYIVSAKNMESAAARILRWAAEGVVISNGKNFQNVMRILTEELEGAVVAMPIPGTPLPRVGNEPERCSTCFRLLHEIDPSTVDYPVSYCKGH